MPHTHAAKKALRQSHQHRDRNLRSLRPLRKLLHDSRRAIRLNQADEAKKIVDATLKAFDRAEAKGIIKKNTTARKKSRLQVALNKLKP